jgi:hypothetical protein
MHNYFLIAELFIMIPYGTIMTLNIMWIVPGMILLGAMLFGGIHLWIKRRREAKDPDLYGSRIRPDDFKDEK